MCRAKAAKEAKENKEKTFSPFAPFASFARHFRSDKTLRAPPPPGLKVAPAVRFGRNARMKFVSLAVLFRRRTVAVFVIACVAITSVIAPAHAAAPAKDRMVLVISIDGFPAWLWADPSLPMPTLRQLAGTGASAARMEISNPSLTWPNHTTLVTGVSPARHGVLYNGLVTPQGPQIGRAHV